MNGIEQIIEGLAVPVIAVDENLTIVASNHLARQAFTDLEKPGGVEQFLEKTVGLKHLLVGTMTSGQISTTKIKAKAGYGSDYGVTMKNIGVVDGSDRPLVLITFEDRSGFRDLKAMRTGFVANVSHEIRSPLTAISGFVETLQGPAIEDVEVRTHFLELMAKEVTRMTNLVSDLLSLSKVEAKQRRVLKNTVLPNQVIDQAIESTISRAKKWGKRLIVDATPDLPAVMGRHDDLVRILINLLENAIHYGRDIGQVHLIARLEQGANPLGKPAIRIAVQDDGEGIPPEEIPNLTQRFYRVDKSRSRNMGGTGLGLAIVKHILVRHRGKMEIESTLGVGSTFTIFLPLAPMQKPLLS